MNDEQAQTIARAIRFISHGEDTPAGLEGLAMAIGNPISIDGSLSSAVSQQTCAIQDLAQSTQNIADAIVRVADALQAK